jgi:hypothetical protein
MICSVARSLEFNVEPGTIGTWMSAEGGGVTTAKDRVPQISRAYHLRYE